MQRIQAQQRYSCVYGKGFGDPPPNSNNKQAQDKRALKRAKKDLQRAKTLGIKPVDLEEAKHGKVDYVTVKNWGDSASGKGNLEDLEVKEFQAGQSALDFNREFSFVLANHLAELEKMGQLKVAFPDGKTIPPFSEWVYTMFRYAAYLTDLHHLHHSLEQAVRCCIANNDLGKSYLSDFMENGKWDRSQIIMNDLEKVKKACEEKELGSLRISQQTTLYGKELIHLGDSKRDDHALQLIASLYGIYMSSLSQGARIGADVAEKLSLVQLDAIDMYKQWPDQIKNPMNSFSLFIDDLGNKLEEAEKEKIMDNIGRAFIQSALVMLPLAQAE